MDTVCGGQHSEQCRQSAWVLARSIYSFEVMRPEEGARPRSRVAAAEGLSEARGADALATGDHGIRVSPGRARRCHRARRAGDRLAASVARALARNVAPCLGFDIRSGDGGSRWPSQWREQKAPGDEGKLLDRWFAAFAAPARRVTVSPAVPACRQHGGCGDVRSEYPSHPKARRHDGHCKALLGTGAGSRILNSYHFGGYLIFRGNSGVH